MSKLLTILLAGTFAAGAAMAQTTSGTAGATGSTSGNTSLSGATGTALNSESPERQVWHVFM